MRHPHEISLSVKHIWYTYSVESLYEETSQIQVSLQNTSSPSAREKAPFDVLRIVVCKTDWRTLPRGTLLIFSQKVMNQTCIFLNRVFSSLTNDLALMSLFQKVFPFFHPSSESFGAVFRVGVAVLSLFRLINHAACFDIISPRFAGFISKRL